MGKVASTLCRYPVGQKFRQSPSISLHFRDKRIFAFNAEIQDGRQKLRENQFGEKLLMDSEDSLWVKNFVEIAVSRSVSELNVFSPFYTEIQDGRQQENDFYEKSPVHFADTL